MKRNVNGFLLAASLLLMTLVSCVQRSPTPYYAVAPSPPAPIVPMQQSFQPAVQMGWMSGIYGAYITDDRGEQFFMDHNEFISLYSTGGYNAVAQYYYSTPRSTYVHIYTPNTFRVSSNAADIAYTSKFRTSYQTASATRTVYHPNSTAITRTIQVKSTMRGYKAAPAPSVTTPTPAVSRPVNIGSTPVANRPVTLTKAAPVPQVIATPSRPPSVQLSKPSPPVTSRPVSISRPSSPSSTRSVSSSSSRSSGRH